MEKYGGTNGGRTAEEEGLVPQQIARLFRSPGTPRWRSAAEPEFLPDLKGSGLSDVGWVREAVGAYGENERSK